MKTNENKTSILYQFLTTIWGISDIEYQKRIWIRGEGPEWDDFTETVCHFFDDGDPILEKYKEYGISDKQYEILKKFRDDFEAFSDGYSEAFEFIDTPEWAEIMEKAKDVLKAFNFVKKTYLSRPQKLDD